MVYGHTIASTSLGVIVNGIHDIGPVPCSHLFPVFVYLFCGQERDVIRSVPKLWTLHKRKPKDGRSVVVQKQIVPVPFFHVAGKITTRQTKRYFHEFKRLVLNVV